MLKNRSAMGAFIKKKRGGCINYHVAVGGRVAAPLKVGVANTSKSKGH